MTFTTSNGVGGMLQDSYGPLIIEGITRQSLAFNPAIATLINTESTTFHLPIISDDVAAGWVLEGAELDPSDAKFSETVVTPSKVATLTKISREFADDTSPAAAEILGASIARSLAQQIDKAFFGSLATPAPAGLGTLTNYVPAAGATPAVDGVTAIDYGTTMSNLDWAASAIAEAEARGATITSFITTPAVALTIAQLKTASGSNAPLLGTDATNGTSRTVFGVPLFVTAAIGTGIIYALAAARVVTVLRNDVRLERSDQVLFTSDQIALRGTARVGFAFASLRSIIKISKGI